MIEKLMAMKIAAELTNSICGTFPTPGVNPQSPGTVSDVLKAENLLEWEVFRIFYSAVSQATADDTNWPPPVGPSGSATAQQAGTAVGQAVAPAISALAPLVSNLPALIGEIIAVTKGQVPVPVTPASTVPPPSAAPAPASTGGVSVGAQVKVGS